MQLPATAVLTLSALLSAAAIVGFSWSITAARVILPCALVVAGLGAFGAPSLAAVSRGGLAVWAFLFACASCGSSLNGMRNLSFRPSRWVHRFVIYSGYGGTFATMAAAALGLQVRGVSGRIAVAVFIATYVLGSTCIFVAKTLTVRRAFTTMPEYRASLGANPDDPDSW